MNQSLLNVAESIIAKAETGVPADSVLREELRKQRGLSRDDSWEISRAVFAYYRWFGWLEPIEGLEQNILAAVSLAEDFRKSPQGLPNAELIARCVPDWIREEVEITPGFARSLQAEPRLWLRVKRGQREYVEDMLRRCSLPETELMPDTLEYTGALDLFRTPEFHEGLFELQDISSQAVSVICAPKPGETWWDACAGEGGKTLHLSELMENKGLIWASDRADWRLKKLKQRTGRAKVFNYRAALWEGGEKLPTKGKFDGVLVDAPCSGVGTWTRNPHARWTTRIEDVRELAEVQIRLLSNVAKSVKPGGKLIYSVCTLTRSEGIAVAEKFETQFAEFRPLPFTNPIRPSAEVASKLTIWPQDCGGNGMFVAAWQKA